MLSWYHIPWTFSEKIFPLPAVPSPVVMTEVGIVPVRYLDYYGLNVTDKATGISRMVKPQWSSPATDGEGTLINVESRWQLFSLKRSRVRGRGYFLWVVAMLSWIVGVNYRRVVDHFSKFPSLRAMQLELNELSHQCIQKALRVKRKSWHVLLSRWWYLSAEKLFFLYRGRRCTPAAETYNIMGTLESFTTRIPTNVRFPEKKFRRLGDQFCKARRVYLAGEPIRPFQSAKASCFLSRGWGGYNREIGLLSMVKGPQFVDPIATGSTLLNVDDSSLWENRPYAEDLFCDATRDINIFRRALNTAFYLLISLTRPLFAYAVNLGERGGKNRVPNIPEGFAQIVAKTIGYWGFRILGQLFPVEFRKKQAIKVTAGGYYKSGDFKDSTSFIFWEGGRVAWDIILDKSPLRPGIREICKLCIVKLIGPHKIFSCSNERSRLRDGYFIRRQRFSDSLDYSKFARMLGYPEYRYPVVGNRQFVNSDEGELGHEFTLDLMSLERASKHLNGMEIRTNHVTTIRGILMSYGIAAPALFILNALPHWQFKALRKSSMFFCSGDDNISRHKNKKECDKLEAAKPETGMVPHDSDKAYESVWGFLFTEMLYLVVQGAKYLKKVPSFAPKSLFPDGRSPHELVTLPGAAIPNLKEVTDVSMRARIISYLHHVHAREYDLLRSKNISIFGPNSIIKVGNGDGLIDDSICEGLYDPPQPSSGYAKDLKPFQWMTTKKFALATGDSIGSYQSRRVTVDDLKATLSAVPLRCPYTTEPPYVARPAGGVDCIVENLERFLTRRSRKYYYSYSLEYISTGVSQGGLPEMVIPSNRGTVIRTPIDVRHDLNPFSVEGWSFPYPRDDIPEFVIPQIESRGGVVSFHSDCHSLVQGVRPTSHPLEPISFESLAGADCHCICDARNLFPSFSEAEVNEVLVAPGHPSRLWEIYSRFLEGLLKKVNAMVRVFWVVLEQPGDPVAWPIDFSTYLVLCRPRSTSLGADTEIVAIRDILLKSGANPNSIRVFTKDKGLLSRLR